MSVLPALSPALVDATVESGSFTKDPPTRMDDREPMRCALCAYLRHAAGMSAAMYKRKANGVGNTVSDLGECTSWPCSVHCNDTASHCGEGSVGHVHATV